MKRLFSAVIAVGMMLVLSMNCLASQSGGFAFEQREVRVGISPFSHFSEEESDGSYSGILIDYLREIQKYTGWKIEYVMSDPGEIVDMLDSGEVDLMGGMIKNSQTEEKYNFAELSSGYAYSTITTHKNQTDYIPNDYDSFAGIRVGVYQKAISRISAFDRFRFANGLSVIPVYFDDPQAWEEAFRTGAVDAQLTSSAKLREDEKIIASFQREPYYFGVAKGSSDLLRELNCALEQIGRINPRFDTDLYKKYFETSDYEEFYLSTEEKKFVSEHPTLRVAAAPDWEPISYFGADGSFQGISADILKIISAKTGFEMEYIPSKSFRESLELLQSDQVDLLVGAASNGLSKNSEEVMFSLPYLPIQTVILHRNRDNIKLLEEPVMASVYGFEYSVIEGCEAKNYDRAEDAIHAVKNGEADFTLISNLAAEHYMTNHGKSGLTLVPTSNLLADLSIALKRPGNPTLLTILDRAIYSIHDAERQSIIFQNTSMKEQLTLMSLIYANPTQAIFTILSVGLLVLLLLFLVMSMRLRLSRKNSLIADTYRMIGELSDEYILAYDFETGKLSLPERFAKLVGVTDSLSCESEQNKEGAGKLIAAFRESKGKPNFSIECACKLPSGGREMFRAICVVIHDSLGRPVRGIGKLVSIQAEMEEKEQLAKMVNMDSLTGLYSKCYCEQLAAEDIKGGEGAFCGAFMLIDIDNFKQANDSMGHLGGDEVLKHLARTLEGLFREGAVLGRWGGDEFIVFMRNELDRKAVATKAQELCESINHTFYYGGTSFALSISVGISFAEGDKSFREVFKAADDALYEIKRTQKNAYRFG